MNRSATIVRPNATASSSSGTASPAAYTRQQPGRTRHARARGGEHEDAAEHGRHAGCEGEPEGGAHQRRRAAAPRRLERRAGACGRARGPAAGRAARSRSRRRGCRTPCQLVPVCPAARCPSRPASDPEDHEDAAEAEHERDRRPPAPRRPAPGPPPPGTRARQRREVARARAAARTASRSSGSRRRRRGRRGSFEAGELVVEFRLQRGAPGRVVVEPARGSRLPAVGRGASDARATPPGARRRSPPRSGRSRRRGRTRSAEARPAPAARTARRARS